MSINYNERIPNNASLSDDKRLKCALERWRPISPDGRVVTGAEWVRHGADWLPTDEDPAFVQSLMKPVTEPGKFASWIAPPARRINNQPIDFACARFD